MPQHDILAAFRTSVARQGYEWKHMADGPVLVERPSAGGSPITSRPLAVGHESLFLQFSRLKPTQDAILKFANAYGFLGTPVTQHFDDGHLSATYLSAPRGELFHAKSVSDRTRKTLRDSGLVHLRRHAWVDHIKGMAAILRAAKKCHAGETLWEGPMLTLGLNKWRVVPSNPARPMPTRSPTPKQRAMEGLFVADRLSRVLGDVAVPHVAWGRGPDGGRLRLVLRPASLIGCLWLQAAMALSEQKRFRECLGPGCANVIELSLDHRRGGRRTDTQFCSDACRSRDYRWRRKEARALARKGLTPAKIAQKLRSNTERVRAWLSKR